MVQLEPYLVQEKSEQIKLNDSGEVARDVEADLEIVAQDAQRLQLNATYPLGDAKRRRSTHRLRAYFYIPADLGINAQTYTANQFYRDLISRIEAEPPDFATDELLANESLAFSLPAIRHSIAAARKHGKRAAAHDLTRQLRTYAAQTRASMRKQTNRLKEELKRHRGSLHQLDVVAQDITKLFTNFVEQTVNLIDEFRSLRDDLVDPALLPHFLDSFTWADEYLSICCEADFTRLIEHIDRDRSAQHALQEVRLRLAERVTSEQEHRRKAGYATVHSNEGRSEQFIYRAGVLVKYVYSIFALETRRDEEGEQVKEFGAAIAAAVAMFFAAVASAAIQTRYGINSTPFVLAIVLSYVVKDRIKEWLKRFFSSRMARWLADYTTRINDPETQLMVGKCREAMSFVSASSIPPAVFKARHKDSSRRIEIESKPEVILKYDKQVILHPARVNKLFNHSVQMVDITRYNVSELLLRADQPSRKLRVYSSDDDVVLKEDFYKTYHMNVVFELSSNDQPSTVIGRIRVVFDRSGILRVEEV